MTEQTGRQFTPHLSPATAWAYALGTSIGWGSLLVTSNTYLAQAGPMGSLLGLGIGVVIMLMVARNYHYLINCIPEAGGSYAYARDVFGHDRGFLTAWFALMTYFAMLWANATSLPLFARYFIGDVFRFGRLYSFFGYDVYLGEAVLTIAGIALVALLCMGSPRRTARIMAALAGLLTAGIAVCAVAALINRGGRDFAPAFIPDSGALGQVLRVACISPWAFIGFEAISHAAAEFSFPHRKAFRVLSVAVLAAAALYALVLLMSVSVYPPRYANWLEYIRDLGNLEGIEALPTFYAARSALGGFGVTLMMLTLLALVITSMIGNTQALSRLLHALASDDILPPRFTELSDRGVPVRAIALVACASAVVPFMGRTAIGWIVDVTTIGATIIYGFVSAAALKKARFQRDQLEQWTGFMGLAAMLVIGASLLVPSLFTEGIVEPESFFLFVVWSVIGALFYHHVIKRDKSRRFGQAILVWIALLSLLLFVSLVWMNQSSTRFAAQAMLNVERHAVETGEAGDIVDQELSALRNQSARSTLLVLLMFGLSLGALISNYNVMRKRAHDSESGLVTVRNFANTDPLTGVKNKAAWVECERAANDRIGERSAEPFAVVVCDVNGLKHINDTQGHKAGDEYIRAACAMICEIFKHSPVFRIGGDEFVVMLSGRDYENRGALMDTLNRRSEENIQQEGRVVISAGMSDFAAEWDATIRDAFERADVLMYQRKQQLKNMGARTR